VYRRSLQAENSKTVSGRFSLDAPSSSGAAGEGGREAATHSFIVKIWLEETASESGEARWRGSVTNVPDGQRQYVSDLTEIGSLIAKYLKEMGVRLGLRWRLWLWLFRP
jgi:hypothetical protein